MIIPRALWRARYPDGFGDRPLPISEFWLHHSVTLAPDLVPPFDDDDAAVRRLEQIGQDRFGGGISYTYPVTPVGRIYVGHSLWRRGAHTKGHNTVGAAFCLVGNYDTLAPTRAQMIVIARTMVDLHRAGKATRHTLNGGHRDVYPTACPGAKAYAAIAEINRIANDMWAGATYDLDVVDGAVWSPSGDLETRDVQELLGVTADGVYGPATTQAVRALQQDLNLTADGLWGPVTEGALMTAILDKLDALSKKVDAVPTRLLRTAVTLTPWTKAEMATPNESLSVQGLLQYAAAGGFVDDGIDPKELAAQVAAELRGPISEMLSTLPPGATPEQIAEAVLVGAAEVWAGVR